MKRPSCTGAGRFCFDGSVTVYTAFRYRQHANTKPDRAGSGEGATPPRPARVDEGTGH